MDLEKLYQKFTEGVEYCKALEDYVKDYPEGKNMFFDNMGNKTTPDSILLQLLMRKQDFLRKPEKVDEKFEQNQQNPVFYHGFSNYMWAQAFVDDKIEGQHIGKGFFGDGFYVTDDQEVAYDHTYVRDDGGRNRNLVLPVRLNTANGAKFSNISKLCKAGVSGKTVNTENDLSLQPDRVDDFNKLVDFTGSLKEGEMKDLFKECMFGENGESVSALGVYLGYDYIFNDGRGSDAKDKQLIVLNTSQLEVEKDSALRMIEMNQSRDKSKQ